VGAGIRFEQPKCFAQGLEMTEGKAGVRVSTQSSVCRISSHVYCHKSNTLSMQSEKA
jgi:hypothetical protein